MPRLSVKAAQNTLVWKKNLKKYQNFEKKKIAKVFFLTVTPEPFSCNLEIFLVYNIFLVTKKYISFPFVVIIN